MFSLVYLRAMAYTIILLVGRNARNMYTTTWSKCPHFERTRISRDKNSKPATLMMCLL